MGAFKIEIVGVGGHGCERKAKPGEKLYQRCGRFTCPDCAAFDFTQRMVQSGMVRKGDSAYSVVLGDDVLAAIDAKGLVPSQMESGEGVQIREPEFIPPGASEVWLRKEPSGHILVWAQFPMKAEFTHWPGDEKSRVVDDMLANERKSGSF